MQLHGSNTNLLADVNVKCPIEMYNLNALGANSGSGTIRVMPNGQVSTYRGDGSGTTTFTRDYTFVGGNAGGRGHNNATIIYAGQFNLQADAGFIVSTKDFEYGKVQVSGKITQDATPRKFNFSTSGSTPAGGKLYLSNPTNDFSGGLGVATGSLYIVAPGAQGLGPISLTNNGKLYFDATPNANWTIDNSLGGIGIAQVEDGTTTYTLTAAGGMIDPGTIATAAGTLQIKGNLAFAQNAGTPATLGINLIGTGSPLTVTSDQLAVTGNVSGIANAQVNVSLAGITSESDVEGKTFTILTCLNDLTGQQFANVTCTTPFTAKVTCGNGQAVMVVGSRPTIQVPAMVQFRGKPAEVPAAQNVQVQNIGFGQLDWTATVRAPAPDWLTLTNASGGNYDSFTLNVNRQAVPVGTHMACIDVSDPNATNTPQSVLVVLHALPETIVSTHSFTSNTVGTHPSTVTANSVNITANLSALPTGTQVYRAVLVTHSQGNYLASYYTDGLERADKALKLESVDAPGVWLDTVAPRHKTLDCTAAVQRALLAGDKTLRIHIVSPQSGFLGSSVRVDVTCDQPISDTFQQVTGLQAVHRTGDTMLTYREVDQPFTSSTITGAQYDAANSSINATNEIRYRIYRSSQPINAETIRTAELVDEIGSLSGWNTEFSQETWSGRVMPMLPMDDMVLAPFGTGIYVHRAKTAGAACYAISRSVSGAEDLSTWIPGYNTTAVGTTEALGTGVVLKWKEMGPVYFNYVNGAMKNYFVKWECPPATWNVPSKPHNYLVAVSPTTPAARPVTVALHSWGATMEDGYGPWRMANDGSLLVATHEIPYDWWTAWHENTGTIRPWLDSVQGNGGGKVRNYSQNRIWSFVNDFVNGHWTVDMNRVAVQGDSMGGSGASMWGIRNDSKFATIFSRVGVHIPAQSPGFLSSFINSYGYVAWNCLYADTGMTAFSYWDSEKYLRDNVATDTPFIIFANGKNDGAIGWNQAWKYAKAMQETRRPHIWAWGQNGHNEGLAIPGTGSDPNLARDKTLPAFTYCSLDNNPGNGTDTDGDNAGGLNRYVWFQQDDSTDTATTWEITCLLISSAPQSTCTVDITPRRCQAFTPAAGTVCNWTNTDLTTGTVIASGTATVDANSLVTLPQMTVSKNTNRIQITTASPLIGDINKDGYVNVGDLQALVAAWASQAGPPPSSNWNADADINEDAYVNVGDLQLLVAHWGEHQ